MPKISLQLDMNRITALDAALRQLDGREVVVGEGAQARIVILPFKLGTLRHAIAKNLKVLRPHVEAFQEARSGVMNEVMGAPTPFINSATHPKEFAEFSEKIKAMAKTARETVELEALPLERLDLELNEIAIDAVTTLESEGLIEAQS